MDGKPRVIFCVGFLISKAGRPLVIDQVWAGLLRLVFAKKNEYNQSSPGFFFADHCFLTNERPSSLDSLFLQNYCCPN